ncbi:hypothetical protein ACHAWF_006794 [Thalassiosira exigua]
MEGEISGKSSLNRNEKRSSSGRCTYEGAKWFRSILTVVYACLFVWQVLFLPESYSSVGKGRGPVDFTRGDQRLQWQQRQVQTNASNPIFSVDILSVGSINQMELLSAQERILGSHRSVRNFFNVTELDDYDPSCHANLTWDHVSKVVKFCRLRSSFGPEVLYMRSQYARTAWLQKKRNPTGWLCAQQRPFAGLRKAQAHYRRTWQALPDYLLILDDDTYYDMDAFRRNHERLDSSEPTVVAGCLVRPPVHLINFTFPFGGFGTIMSKGSLGYLFHPIDCPLLDKGAHPGTRKHSNSEGICNQLSRNLVGELQYFENGDSLVDLIYKYVNVEKYRDVDRWTTGFCMHSDWVTGYFVNFYNASIHVKQKFYENVPHARMEAYKDSVIYARPTGFCKNDRINHSECRRGSEICHRASIGWMEREVMNRKS